jgi:hypothetical protein
MYLLDTVLRPAGRHRPLAIAIIALVAGSAAACADAPTGTATNAAPLADVASATVNSGSGAFTGDRVNINIPSVFAVQDRCAGGRFGEIIVFEGNQHLVFSEMSTANGHLNMKIHWNADDVTGIGQYTGLTYRATGVTQTHTVSNAPLPYTETMINNYHVIGQGTATNGDLHETVHITVNANGEVTAYVTDYNFDCKGTPTF